jgi:hypothetical protein
MWVDHILGAAGTNEARQTSPSNCRANDPIKKMYMDLHYWSTITYQGRNNNQYLKEELGVIHQVADSYLSIIDAGIQLSCLKRMYYSQSGVFFIPPLDTAQLFRVHGITMGIPLINDLIYQCEPTPGQLFTNGFGGLPDWILSPEGGGRGQVVIESWPAELTTMDKGEGLAPHVEECTRLPIPEGRLISEYANGQSGDQLPPPEEVD